MPQKKIKPKLLWIAGAGRSGSTLLCRMLGQRKNIFPMGETRHLWLRDSEGEQLCGCGEKLLNCSVWGETYKDKDLINSISNLDNSILRLSKFPHVYLSTCFERPGKAILELSRKMEQFYCKVLERTDADIILETSRSPLLGLILMHMTRFDVQAIHLVRDSRAVANSWNRTKKRPEIWWKDVYIPRRKPSKAAFLWLLVNVLNELTLRKMPESMRVRYEDLVTDPISIMDQIMEFIHQPQSESDNQTAWNTESEHNHIVKANPSKFSPTLKIQPDMEWRKKTGEEQKTMVTALSFPLLIRYGYKLKV